ncbi:glycosyltransferase family 4 protein [Candidatus Peregrinibacteria bacterium]|nr:glycosyltransferase family 4 protein [Candidatus Peregrinibacteria bacterium]
MKKNKLKIGIGLRGLTKGGVTRFIFSLLKEFEKHSKDFDFYIFYNDKRLKDKFGYAKKIYIKGKSKLIWDYIKYPMEAKRYNLDYLLFPKNIIPFSFIFNSAKKINIIHDLAHFEKKLNAYRFWDSIYMKSLMKISCKIAKKVLAVSESTKNDIHRILKISESKIKVIYEGVEGSFKKTINPNLLKKLEVQTPYIFYCGTINPRKNLLRALKGFNEIKDKIPHKFYITGGRSWGNENIMDYIDKNLIGRVVLIGHIKEDELIAMYSSSDLFVYPSLYEGFGLPILEAQACGCPVLTSNVTSCPEVAGEGAGIVNPYSVTDISSKMLKILQDKAYSDNLIKKGYENLKRFSWEKTAENIINMVNETKN